MGKADTAPTVLEGEGGSSCAVYYSAEIANRIASHYAEGKSLHWISNSVSEMPNYNTMLRWAKENTEFRVLLDAVRTARALHFEDKAIDAAESARGKDADRLKFDAYKWGAEINDPSRYGKKVTHGGDSSRPIVFQINTGFPEPNVHQRPPELGSDGIIIKKAKPVNAEVTDVEVSSDTREDDGRASASEDSGVRPKDAIRSRSIDQYERLCAIRSGEGHEEDPA